ncbi:MAG: U32 family peptidase [Methanopyri archaeon]|nr:U32 family peptidase [Methanopyri archaeon]
MTARSMHVLAPISSPDEVVPLAEVGADEFYCGLLPPEWLERYGLVGSINRRYEMAAQMTDPSELVRAVELAHGRSASLFVTLNAHYYVPEQYPFLARVVDDIVSAGADGLLVADPAFMLWVREQGHDIPLHLSAGGAVLNPRAASFMWGSFGLSRIVLPRHLTLGEITELVTTLPDIKFEVFIINEPCINVDGLCTFQHGLTDITGDDLNCCDISWDLSLGSEDADPVTLRTIRSHVASGRRGSGACGACALHDLQSAGVCAVKVVGRGLPIKDKVRDVAFVAGLVRFLEEEGPDRDAFVAEAKQRHAREYRTLCKPRLCYYPEPVLR